MVLQLQLFNCRPVAAVRKSLAAVRMRTNLSNGTSSSSPSSSPTTDPRPLVLCGPSGSGKSTLMKKLTEEFREAFGFCVSHTTRQPRPGERDGVEYHFVTKEMFTKLVSEGAFLEFATFSGNNYGTSRAAVESVQQEGKICILDIDVQGVKNIKGTDLQPDYVFIKPPSRAALEERLRARRTESEQSLAKRLAAAAAEMDYGETEGNFHRVIVNDELEAAYSELREFMLPKISFIQQRQQQSTNNQT